MTGKKIILHIGTHKTGSTSLQRVLYDCPEVLSAQGYAYYTGYKELRNHIELYLACMRTGRDSFGRQKYHLEWTPEYFARIRTRVHEFLDHADAPTVVFSTEGLSLLRFGDELERLKELLRADENEVHPLVVTRNRDAYLASYRRTILRHADRQLSSDPTSAFYVESDSWLGDFDGLIACYEEAFDRTVVRIDYDRSVEREGNVLAPVLESMGLDTDAFGDLERFRKNQNSWLRTWWLRFVKRSPSDRRHRS